MLRFLRFIGRPLFRILFSVEYHGLENVPETGPVIIAGNHPSYLDPILIGLPIKRVIKYMAWDALFRVPLLGPLIESLGAFPVDVRRGKGEAAFREAVTVLQGGHALVIFPEGQRSERGPMGELRTGVARLAIESGAPIVPVTIGGAFRAWPRFKLLPKPAKIIVRFHRPIEISDEGRQEHRDDRQFHYQLTGRIAASINRSLAPSLRGSEAWERWYRQPPSHIRIYEWVPLIAAVVATLIAHTRGRLEVNWVGIWLPPASYYLYLTADLPLIRPSRPAKWVRNSSLALLLYWPHGLGTLVAVLTFVVVFGLWYRTTYYRVTVLVVLLAVGAALYFGSDAELTLLVYGGLGGVALGYLQTFVNAAYDIRKSGVAKT